MSTQWTRVLRSTLAAALGVQSQRNREKDFEEGNAGAFIAAGILFTALFIASVLAVVNWVTS